MFDNYSNKIIKFGNYRYYLTIVTGLYGSGRRKYCESVQIMSFKNVIIDLDEIENICNIDNQVMLKYKLKYYIKSILKDHQLNKDQYERFNNLIDKMLVTNYLTFIGFIKYLYSFCEDNVDFRNIFYLIANFDQSEKIHKLISGYNIRFIMIKKSIFNSYINRCLKISKIYFNQFDYVLFPFVFLFRIPIEIKNYNKTNKIYNDLLIKFKKYDL